MFLTKIDRINYILNNYEEICWKWTGGIDKDGYGRFSLKMGNGILQKRAHRISYALFVGDIPKNKYVLHKCDTRSCVNPSHLFLGDLEDNMRDMVSKDRQARGERNGNAKLTERHVLEILRDKKSSNRELSKKYQVSDATISLIKSKEKWKHIKAL